MNKETELEKEIGLLKQRLEQQQLEIRRLKYDERMARQKYRRLVQKYGDLLYTFEWLVKAHEKSERMVADWSRKYEVLDRRYRRLVQSKAGKAILKVQAAAKRIKK
ncbi:hypothetical protein [Exiguobacterium sp. AM39-5BH]|uniref:hypothetical protein n=1 Tax=Exiguobacterium sp. AM39-5BH TaxID=2292355 RepID=UPI000FE26DC0|nr:hypothetical protein [Exiguobacterium sp. AM39-5BH]RHB49650.1 hypothetical protein DW881_07625 [Exiguobacterium sp. AM39-5BH]